MAPLPVVHTAGFVQDANQKPMDELQRAHLAHFYFNFAMISLAVILGPFVLYYMWCCLRNWGRWRIRKMVPAENGLPYYRQSYVQTWRGWILQDARNADGGNDRPKSWIKRWMDRTTSADFSRIFWNPAVSQEFGLREPARVGSRWPSWAWIQRKKVTDLERGERDCQKAVSIGSSAGSVIVRSSGFNDGRLNGGDGKTGHGMIRRRQFKKESKIPVPVQRHRSASENDVPEPVKEKVQNNRSTSSLPTRPKPRPSCLSVMRLADNPDKIVTPEKRPRKAILSSTATRRETSSITASFLSAKESLDSSSTTSLEQQTPKQGASSAQDVEKLTPTDTISVEMTSSASHAEKEVPIESLTEEQIINRKADILLQAVLDVPESPEKMNQSEPVYGHWYLPSQGAAAPVIAPANSEVSFEQVGSESSSGSGNEQPVGTIRRQPFRDAPVSETDSGFGNSLTRRLEIWESPMLLDPFNPSPRDSSGIAGRSASPAMGWRQLNEIPIPNQLSLFEEPSNEPEMSENARGKQPVRGTIAEASRIDSIRDRIDEVVAKSPINAPWFRNEHPTPLDKMHGYAAQNECLGVPQRKERWFTPHREGRTPSVSSKSNSGPASRAVSSPIDVDFQFLRESPPPSFASSSSPYYGRTAGIGLLKPFSEHGSPNAKSLGTKALTISETVFLKGLNRKLDWLEYELSPGFRGPDENPADSYMAKAGLTLNPVSRVTEATKRELTRSSAGSKSSEHSTPPPNRHIRKKIPTPRIDSWRIASNKARRVSLKEAFLEPITQFGSDELEPREGELDTAAWVLRRPPQGIPTPSAHERSPFVSGGFRRAVLDDDKPSKKTHRRTRKLKHRMAQSTAKARTASAEAFRAFRGKGIVRRRGTRVSMRQSLRTSRSARSSRSQLSLSHEQPQQTDGAADNDSQSFVDPEFEVESRSAISRDINALAHLLLERPAADPVMNLSAPLSAEQISSSEQASGMQNTTAAQEISSSRERAISGFLGPYAVTVGPGGSGPQLEAQPEDQNDAGLVSGFLGPYAVTVRRGGSGPQLEAPQPVDLDGAEAVSGFLGPYSVTVRPGRS
ncbi:MAG: hypothetical protein M1819_006714 [Sarea resinae]|nr:MAG: hypothetical protein M1819_006714 [Sarea resinae]